MRGAALNKYDTAPKAHLTPVGRHQQKDGELFLKFFVYSRKSVYTGKGESIENQIEMCKQYIHTKFPDVADTDITLYEDEGFSAKNTDRPQFQEMLKNIRQHKPDFVVCYRLDRISRNVSDFSTLIEELNRRDISFVCIKEEFDTSKPMGKAMMYIASVFAQLERETIAERIRDNMLMLARTGRWLGGTTPTGYTSEKLREIILDGKVKTSCKLKENPEELRAVDMIFETFLELRSISGVSKRLTTQGMTSRNGKPYSLFGIKQILQNPVYCAADKDAFDYFTAGNADVCFAETACTCAFGLLSYNKRDYKKKHTPRQPMDKWIIAMGKHKGRIPGKKWVVVQKILEDNIPTGEKPGTMHNTYSLLSGVIYCETCGSRMFAKRRTGKGANPDFYDYLCSRKLRGGTDRCSCQNINGTQADAMVCEALMGYTADPAIVCKLLEVLKRGLQRQAQENPLRGIDLRIKTCNAEIHHLIDLLARDKFDPASLQQINTRIVHLSKEHRDLVQKREQLQKSTTPTAETETQIDKLAKTLTSLKHSFPLLSVYEKRIFIKQLVQKITWNGTDLHIFIGSK